MKNALVTGASRGIGKAIAKKLASSGYDLVLTCHTRAAALGELADDLSQKYGIRCAVHSGDISDESFVDRLFDSIDSLDVLINNAGISHIGLLQDMTMAQWERVLKVNLTSAFLTCRRAIPLMLGNNWEAEITGSSETMRGSIINISSMWGRCGASMEAAYSAAKGGLNTLTRALAKELAPSAIQVNAIACGVIDTEMNSFLTDEERLELEAEIPAGRFAKPEEVAEAVSSILNAGTYMTGQIIGFDGGYI